jgi:TonB-dependent SusC/RagA subfamily outer membrane receptor
VRIDRKDIESVEVMKGQAAAAMYGAAAATGVIVVTLKDGTVKRIPVGPDGPSSVLMIDGMVSHDCSSESNWIQFQGLRDREWQMHLTFKIF